MGRILIRSLDLMKNLNFLQTENTILLLLPEIIFEKLQKFFFLGGRKREKRNEIELFAHLNLEIETDESSTRFVENLGEKKSAGNLKIWA